MKTYKLFINNKWKEAKSGDTLKTINPANGKIIAEIASANIEDVDLAVNAARKAFKLWSKMDPDKRASYLLKVANYLKSNLNEFAKWETINNGKPIKESFEIDIPLSIRAIEYFANISREIQGHVIPIPGREVFDYVTYEPFGVVGTIVPWNYPLHLATRSCIPALAAGNTVVLKPSSLTSITALMMAEAFLKAEFPEGVFNLVTGPGNITGEAVLTHPNIDLISFTGSTEVGKKCVRNSIGSNKFKKIILELGGKGAFIVLPDADIDGAINSLIPSFCQNQGEICCASTRLLLHYKIYNKFIEKLVERCNSIKIGDPLDFSTQMGSLTSIFSLNRIKKYVKIGLEEGAKLICGGAQYLESPCENGFFFRPTIFENVTTDMSIAKDEIFGPVLAIFKYKKIEEAIAIANNTDYGLGAVIFSNDPRNLISLAKELNVGSVWMNCMGAPIEAPYGGNKNSGIGRENGKIGLKEYLTVKNNMIFIGNNFDNYYGFKD